jgi:L-lactate dehydrogenase complex protein LldG
MSSRDNILRKLRAAPRPFQNWPPIIERVEGTPLEDRTPAGLLASFIARAEALACTVYVFDDPAPARDQVLALIGEDRGIQSWDTHLIPLPGLGDALAEREIAILPGDASVRVGLTGVDAALAGTGSIVLESGPGKPRLASLLPPAHVAIMTTGQIVPTLEAWMAAKQRGDLEAFAATSNISIISGPSRTGDIAMELVMGVHGPGEVHLILLKT